MENKEFITINDFIKELQSISENKRNLPLVMKAPNGQLCEPMIKMYWDKDTEIFSKQPDKMIITVF